MSEMPSVGEDWQLQPLLVVDRLFETARREGTASQGDWKVEQFFADWLTKKDSWSWVPSLNDTPLHLLKPDSLVRFRCMVQDIFDSEFYLGIYEANNSTTGEKVVRTGKYRDVADSREESVDVDAAGNVIFERQPLYCVPIPGEAEWAKEAYRNMSKRSHVEGTASLVSTTGREKRRLDDEESETEEKMEMEMTHDDRKEKRIKCERGETHGASADHPSRLPDLNFPLSTDRGPACLVKMYDHRDEYKVNDVLEVFGILSVDPLMAHLHDDEAACVGDPSVDSESSEERLAHNFPPSLVPRLHCVVARRLDVTNPLIPLPLTHPGHKAVVESIKSEASAIRSELLSFLSCCCLGDALCAEYLLLHLLSSVYARRDIVAVGKYCLNICGCLSGEWAHQIANVVQEITTKSFCFPLSLENLNSISLVPQKDYVANRLKSGILQLSDGTHLVLDETAMLPGQLQEQGVKNVNALSDLIQWQKVQYDFKYHTAEFPCNIPVLILSEGQSLLPADCRIFLHVSLDTPLPSSSALMGAMSSGIIEKIRLYLDIIPCLNYNLSEDAQKMVQEDFVAMRRADPSNVTADTLHHLLNISRLLVMSFGQSHLTAEIWEIAKQLETKKQERLSSRSHPSGSSS
ncbi:mini-chromosome maintenance complex-binding protein-like [Corticium candelabrum]|uniref:mini-chromosome maintenance complex-binding protein-like n=1 Tax=Corticium candelabrum TaxID=121492 RepID=UPI002E266D87|nr:mini-chromosome maintenance complex-binding protein-like [Corticium candelabrum]